MRTIYFLLFALLTGNIALPNTKQGTINGVVLDEQSKPIDYVTIGLFKTSDSSLVKTALTTADGKFEFANINTGSYFVKANMMGYGIYKGKTFQLTDANLVLSLEEIRLKTNSKTLNTVSITVIKPLIERKTDKLVMNVENSSIAIGSSALEVLQKAPGVTVDQNDNISMQGKQGVLILLDGKQTYMSSADVANLLRNMQSSELETIELITNPSSKYDASGNSGIINIKTKKNKNGGTNGSVNATAGYGKNFRGNAGINLNNRTNHVNIFGNYNYGLNGRDNFISIDRISNGSPDTYFMQDGNSFRKRYNNNFKAGIDYFIDKKNTIGLLVNGYLNNGTETNNSNTLIGPSFQQRDSSLVSDNIIRNKYNNLAYNLNYKSILDTAGQEISADLDYSRYNGNDNATYNNSFFYANGTPIRPTNYIRNATPTKIDIKAFKIDYTVALSKSIKLEAGVKSSWVKTDNDLRAEEYKNNVWQNDVRRSNQFVYDENVNAAYTNFNKQFKNTSVQLGLRVEQTNSTGNLITNNTVVKRSYWDFFPTAFIQQTLSKNNQIGFSYSRRIDRPSYDALNPFVYYLDQYTYSKGNPFLNPQYTHNFEVSYTFMQKYLLSINYSRVNDVITEVILPDPAQKALYQTNANIAKNISYGFNLNIPVKIAKWWETNNNLNVFNLSFEAPNLAGKVLKTGKTSFQFKTQHTFIIVSGLTGELSGNYESPLDYGTLSIQSRYFVDMGLSKSLFNKKASLKLALSDVFNTMDTELTSAYPGLKYDLYQKNESQIGRISFTYRFGKNEIKPARRRSTGTEDEQGRMKN
ncbi:TonB-dependent receptor [Pedobacter sp. LMG 31464]|uniref:TonB-dependent receptor n=1 Tax=Pedobacter planticolens TaxID=2679964 RepID=A0A923IWH0_9SPHI|nr:TonB-dependent receptor [Pedobacter planticolens]MBB2146174.1 TonB-dependent receptor [Pedobacter planticolens]